MQNDLNKVSTIQDLASIMFREFARINDQFGETNKELRNLQEGQKGLKADIITLQEGQKGLKADIITLQEGQKGLKADIANLQEGQRALIARQDKVEEGQRTLKKDLEKKIENEIENLALITKRGFDEMTGNFREIHEELDQVKNHVIGIERRVTKLEEAKIAK